VYYKHLETRVNLFVDFFESGSAPTSATLSADEAPTAVKESLPEGFFDDPKADAKVNCGSMRKTVATCHIQHGVVGILALYSSSSMITSSRSVVRQTVSPTEQASTT